MSRVMISIAASVLAISCAASSAQAQERFSWSGFYVGAGAGAQRTSVGLTFPTPLPATTSSASHSFDNAVLSGHFGYQQQFGGLVLGAEISGSGTPANWFKGSEAQCAFPTPFQDRCDVNAPASTFTAGARVGWTPVQRWLVFVSGGYAAASLDTGIRFGAIAAPPAPGLPPVTQSRVVHNGWFIGGGVEHAISRNIVVGFDYKHIEVGAEGHCAPPGCASPSALNRNVSADIDQFQARLSYRFGTN